MPALGTRTPSPPPAQNVSTLQSCCLFGGTGRDGTGPGAGRGLILWGQRKHPVLGSDLPPLVTACVDGPLKESGTSVWKHPC